MKPFFSIIIPMYNVETYVSRCIESCIYQSFKNIEILIVDDCGTDNSIFVAQEYAQIDNRILIINNKHNLGLFHTRLNGIKHAHGKYILFLDADDYLNQNICEKIYSILEKDLSIDMLHFGFERTPKQYNFFSFHSPHMGYLYQNQIKNFLILSNTFQSIWGKAIRTSILQSIAQELHFIRPPLNTLEDGIFNILLSFNIEKYYGCDYIGYFYETNPNSISRSLSLTAFNKKYFDVLKVLEILDILDNQYPNEKNIIKKYKKKALSLIFLEARFFSFSELIRIYNTIKKSKANALLLPKYILGEFPTFWTSCIISMRLFFRWQTLARLLINIFTLGKIKL